METTIILNVVLLQCYCPQGCYPSAPIPQIPNAHTDFRGVDFLSVQSLLLLALHLGLFLLEDEMQRGPSTCIDCDSLEVETFMYTGYNWQNMVNEIDPDNNLFANTNIDCRYYAEMK
ncbi:uncharacterized protein V6R79_007047 [Siganus canaliculatus]